MREKIVYITRCDDCPYFDNEYYSFNTTCSRLNRVMVHDDKYNYIIPDDCPLGTKED